MSQQRERKLNKGIKELVRFNLGHVIDVISKAEKAGAPHPANPQGMAGEDKLDEAVTLLNGLIDIPFLPEWMEHLLLKAIVTTVVELAQHLFGKAKWTQKLTGKKEQG